MVQYKNILMEVCFQWLMLSAALVSAAAPAPTPAPPVLSPRAIPSIRSMLALAWIAAPAPMLAPWALSARAKSKRLT